MQRPIINKEVTEALDELEEIARVAEEGDAFPILDLIEESQSLLKKYGLKGDGAVTIFRLNATPIIYAFGSPRFINYCRLKIASKHYST